MEGFSVDAEFDKMMQAIGLGHLAKDDIQYMEMHKAFYGGCMVMFQTVVNLQALDDEVAVKELNNIASNLMEVKF